MEEIIRREKLYRESWDLTAKQLATTCAELASNKKAEEIVVLDLAGISSFTDFFVRNV